MKPPYYDVLVGSGTVAVRSYKTLRSARLLKKTLKQQGKDAFIMKVYSGTGGALYETVVR